MKRFVRTGGPEFWASYETDWLGRTPEEQRRLDPLRWKRGGVTLAEHFHQTVRPEAAPRLCAYCDGCLAEQSPATVDHFEPRALRPDLSITWTNLFPACADCNSTYKLDAWTPTLLRPDRDDVEAMFEFNARTGRLEPNPALSAQDRQRASEAIAVFGLNEGQRPEQRRAVWRRLARPPALLDAYAVVEHSREGPYRFVADRVRAARGL